LDFIIMTLTKLEVQDNCGQSKYSVVVLF
jgi:hypothetical protein